MKHNIFIFLLILYFKVFIECKRHRTYYTINITSFAGFRHTKLKTDFLPYYTPNEKRDHPRILKAFNEYSKTLNRSYESINNINSVFEAFSNQNCLIVLNNFRGVNLNYLTEIPLITRRTKYAFLDGRKIKRKSVFGSVDPEIIWIPYEVSSFVKKIFL